MKKFTFAAFTAFLVLGLAGIAHADTLSGKVTSVDTGGNSLTLASDPGPDNKAQEYKLVWDDDLADITALEGASLGDTLTVNAEQNVITRNWKVTSASGGYAARASDMIQGDERMISGEIRSIDPNDNSLTLASKDLDETGQPLEYRVVWDDANANVREKIEKSEVGDNISLSATQNVISRNWKANSIAGRFEAMGEGDVRTLTGEVKRVDPEKNFLVLSTTDDSGKAVERKVVWDKDFQEQAELENAQIGEQISVRADQNFFTRNWKVQSLG
jgi:hypothetical protein